MQYVTLSNFKKEKKDQHWWRNQYPKECCYSTRNVIFYLYLNMIILFNASSDCSRNSRDGANKTSCLPGNKYRVSSLRKSRDFLFQKYKKKANVSIRC